MWLRHLASSNSPLAPEDALVYGEYLALLEFKLARHDELDRRIEALALTPALATAVAYLQRFRGLQVHGAMVLAFELVDWRRFAPGQLMAYLGLIPREHSTGDLERRGSITQAGNTHCRHVLIQAAWSYRHKPRIGTALKKRRLKFVTLETRRVLLQPWSEKQTKPACEYVVERLHIPATPAIHNAPACLRGAGTIARY